MPRRRTLSPCENAFLALFQQGVIGDVEQARTMAFVGGEALRAYASGVVERFLPDYHTINDGGLAAALVPAAIESADFTLIARAIIAQQPR
jgi:hypothetical protein